MNDKCQPSADNGQTARLLAHLKALSQPSPSAGSLFRRFVDCVVCGVGQNTGVVVVSNNGLGPRQWQITAQFCPIKGAVTETPLLFSADPKAHHFRDKFFDDLSESSSPEVAAPLPASLQTVLGPYLGQFNAVIALPIFISGGVENWVLLFHPEADGFAHTDFTSLTAVANLAAAYVVRLNDIAELRHANAWIERELDEIANIQWTLLPQEDRHIPGMISAFGFNTFARAGGDYFDLVSLRSQPETDSEPDVWGAIIADVAGHGASAAVEAAMLDAILRTYSGRVSDGPACVLNYVNRHLFTRRIRGTFTTTFIANYHRPSRTLRFSNAGHPPALLKPAADPTHITQLEGGEGIPLGVEKSYAWTEEQRQLELDDVLFMYTDGVVETRSPAGQSFGVDRLRSILAANPSNPRSLVDAVQNSLVEFRGSEPQRDDYTLLAIQIKDT